MLTKILVDISKANTWDGLALNRRPQADAAAALFLGAAWVPDSSSKLSNN